MENSKKFTQKAQDALDNAIRIACEFGHSYVGSEHILLGLMKDRNSVASTVLDEMGVILEDVERLIRQQIEINDRSDLNEDDFTPKTRKILDKAFEESLKAGKKSVGTEDILLSIIEQKDSYAVKLLEELGVNSVEVSRKISGALVGEVVASDFVGGIQEYVIPRAAKFRGQDAESSLKRFGTDLVDRASEGKIDPVIGRDKEIGRLMQILCRRTKNNPCLIGEPGVGKTAVVEGLALKIALGSVPDILRDKKVVSVDFTGMIAGTKYRGDFEDRIKSLVEEVKKSENIILFVDEFHTIVGIGSAEGSADAANILKPMLTKGDLQIIGATTMEEYRKNVEKDPALERRFQPIIVSEPTEEEAIKIVKGLKPKYEQFHKVEITDKAVEAAVKMSSRYIADRFLPDKAIDLIDEAASSIKMERFSGREKVNEVKMKLKTVKERKEEAINNQNFEVAAKARDDERELKLQIEEEERRLDKVSDTCVKRVTVQDIAKVVSQWTSIPVLQLTSQEAERLMNMEKVLESRVVGQEKAVSAVAKAIRRGRTGIRDPKRPIGSFVFLGPTGVGKTELCRALSEIVFGNENAMIRFDMSEFMEKHTSSKLIGSPPGYIGYGEGGKLTEQVRRKPYSVVLFDEIEKAHPDIFNILLQILEDGVLTDSQGRKVSFKNTIIIMTSNIGAKLITQKGVPLGFTSLDAAQTDANLIKDSVMKELKKAFKPELLNRIDEIIIFDRLSKESSKLISQKMLSVLESRLKSLGISVHFSESAIEAICKKGFDKVYGARPLRRTIQKNLEDILAEKILSKEIKKSDKVICNYESDNFVFVVQNR